MKKISSTEILVQHRKTSVSCCYVNVKNVSSIKVYINFIATILWPMLRFSGRMIPSIVSWKLWVARSSRCNLCRTVYLKAIVIPSIWNLKFWKLNVVPNSSKFVFKHSSSFGIIITAGTVQYWQELWNSVFTKIVETPPFHWL